MITHPLVYLLSLASVSAVFVLLEKRVKLFKYIPAVVMIYAISMLGASLGVFDFNADVTHLYTNLKSNLLPAMLFLMLLQIDFTHFLKLGKSLIIAYILAVLSIAFSFIFVLSLFHFDTQMSGAFGALAGSWMGGTANMIAVGSALGVSENAFAYALVVDSVNYTLWVMLLLFLVPFAHIFNRFMQAQTSLKSIGDIGCACSVGTKRYWLFILLSITTALLVNFIATHLTLISHTTTTVLLASFFGILGSFTPLKKINGSQEIANSMLYLLLALIGSRAVIESFDGFVYYVLVGFCILLLHAILMLIGAKIFKLDLFSISVASLANIGGIASAPLLAATYNKSLVSVGVFMALMGYLIGTFGGLAVGKILLFSSGV